MEAKKPRALVSARAMSSSAWPKSIGCTSIGHGGGRIVSPARPAYSIDSAANRWETMRLVAWTTIPRAPRGAEGRSHGPPDGRT